MIRHHGVESLQELGALGGEGIAEFLTDLAREEKVAVSTQNQAASALQFLFVQVLGGAQEDLGDFVRARRSRRVPVVLSYGEVGALLAEMTGPTRLMAVLLYGSGLRLMECTQLRVKDFDLDLHPRAQSWWSRGAKPARCDWASGPTGPKASLSSSSNIPCRPTSSSGRSPRWCARRRILFRGAAARAHGKREAEGRRREEDGCRAANERPRSS